MEEQFQYVRRSRGEEFKAECVKQSVKHPTQAMIWSVMSVYGPGRLYIVEGTMKQEQYKNVLLKRLIPQMKDWANSAGLVLQTTNFYAGRSPVS